MRFGNSIRLTTENFKQVFKLLLYQLITILIFGALCSAFIIPEVVEIIERPETKTLAENFKNIFIATFTTELENPEFYIKAVFGENGSLKQFFNVLISLRWQIVLAAVGCVLVYLVKRFADTVVFFTVGSLVNDKMAKYAETPFGTAFVANLGKACAYAGVYVPVVFAFDLLTFLVCCLLLRFLPLIAALFLSVTLIVVCQSLKLTFTSQWMPAMTSDGKKLSEALRFGDKQERKQQTKVFAIYIVTVYLIIAVNVGAALCTFGSALLITIPMSYLLLICQQHVNYYTIKGKKYFITYESIATNPDHGDSEHFFEYIEAVEKEESQTAETVETKEEK